MTRHGGSLNSSVLEILKNQKELSLFFISGHISGGLVTVIDGYCMIYYTTTVISAMESLIHM
jgi:hypothetical protein